VKGETKFSRKNRWATAIVASVTVLAVAIGPLCAPICSGKYCAVGASEAAENKGCHGAAAQQDEQSQSSLAAVKECRAGDIAAILSNLGEKKQISPVSGNIPANLVFTTDSAQLLEPKTTIWPRCCDRSNPLRQPDVSLRTTNLRI
jgi:hypothetical protein